MKLMHADVQVRPSAGDQIYKGVAEFSAESTGSVTVLFADPLYIDGAWPYPSDREDFSLVSGSRLVWSPSGVFEAEDWFLDPADRARILLSLAALK